MNIYRKIWFGFPIDVLSKVTNLNRKNYRIRKQRSKKRHACQHAQLKGFKKYHIIEKFQES